MNTQTISQAEQININTHRHNALLEIEEVELQAAECRAAGIDDSEYENYASYLRREFCKQFGRG